MLKDISYFVQMKTTSEALIIREPYQAVNFNLSSNATWHTFNIKRNNCQFKKTDMIDNKRILGP